MNQNTNSPAVVRFCSPDQREFWLAHLIQLEAKLAAEREARR
jgi:hypothetical protein